MILSEGEAQFILQSFERECGIILPQDYREFQKSRDQDDLMKRSFLCMTADGVRDIRLRMLYPLVNSMIDLRTMNRCLRVGYGDGYPKGAPGRERLVVEPIAIGGCADDEDLLLYAKGDRYGQVWIKMWETVEATGFDRPEDDLYFVSSSFGEFLGMLSSAW